MQLQEIKKANQINEDDLPLAWHIIKDALADGKKVTYQMYSDKGDKMRGDVVKLYIRKIFGADQPWMEFREEYDILRGNDVTSETGLTIEELEGAEITPIKNGLHLHLARYQP